MPGAVRNTLQARMMKGQTRAVTIHAEHSWYDTILAGKFDFFTKMEHRLTAEGVALRIVRSPSTASRVLRDGNGAHIIVADLPQPGPRVLHAMPSHIWGFWHLDPKGALQHSQITDKSFDPNEVDEQEAKYFFNGVAGYMLRENVTRHAQEPRRETPLPSARAAVFVQHIDQFKTSQPYVETLSMLDAVLNACAPGRVTVKLHPHQRPETIAEITALVDLHPQAELCTASVHDQIAAADVVVTQNSTAGFEALMQRKPVVTCAPTAFHHATLVARTPTEIANAIHSGPEQQADFAYAPYFYWFLSQNCLEPAKPDFADRAWEILQAHCGL